MSQKINPQIEAKIVAMIARGDNYLSIKEQLEKENISVSKPTISNIKKRNKDTIAIIHNKVTDLEIAKTEGLLEKSRSLIERKLDASLDTSVPPYLQKLLDNGDITQVEFQDRYNKIMDKREIAIKDLTTVSKEMFNQSQIESGRPTSITNSPELAKAQLKTLLEAINSGDEKEIVKAIFIDA